jgi:carboxypeptidase family protein
MRRSATIRYLVGAWVTVLAILALAYFFLPESEQAPSQVSAAYERMPERRAPKLPRAEAPDGPREREAETAEVSSTAAASVALIQSWTLPTGDARVFGTVTLEATGQPVEGVRVQLRNRDGWQSWSVTTDASGLYSFEELPGGVYRLASGDGGADTLHQVVRRGLIVGDEDERRVDFRVKQGGRVWGRITDAQGTPIPRAKILVGTSESAFTQVANAARKQHMLASTSDENGDYVVSGVPFEREWRVWADKDELAPLLSPPFVLHPSRPHLRMDVTLLAGTTIFGTVSNSQGEPLNNVELACFPRYGSFLAPMSRARTARDARSEKDGSFAISGLPAGDYQVMGFKEGYRFALKGKPVYPDGRSDIHGLRIVLESALGEGSHSITGRVVDGEGNAIPGADVGLAAFGTRNFSFGGTETETAEDGSFRFEGLAKSSFMLAVKKEGFEQRILEQVALDRDQIVTLSPEAKVRGRVRFPGKTPSQYTVRVLRVLPAVEGEEPNEEGGLSRLAGLDRGATFADTSGKFELSGVPRGRLLLEARAAGLPPGRVIATVRKGAATEGVVIEVPAEGGKIEGRVVTFAGAPISEASVRLVELGGSAASGILGFLGAQRGLPEATTDEEGNFLLEDLPSASFQVIVSHPDYAPTVLPLIQAAAGQPATRADATLTGGGAIAGRAPVGAMITVAGEGFSRMASSSEAGDFEFERVPPGTYLARAVVTSEEDPTQTPEILRLRVTIKESVTSTLDFTAPPTGKTVTGRLEPGPEEGEIGMAVLMLPSGKAPDPNQLIWQGQVGVGEGEASRHTVGEALLHPNGTYVLPNVPKGRYVLYLYTNSVMRSLTGDQARLRERREIKVD